MNTNWSKWKAFTVNEIDIRLKGFCTVSLQMVRSHFYFSKQNATENILKLVRLCRFKNERVHVKKNEVVWYHCLVMICCCQTNTHTHFYTTLRHSIQFFIMQVNAVTKSIGGNLKIQSEKTLMIIQMLHGKMDELPISLDRFTEHMMEGWI